MLVYVTAIDGAMGLNTLSVLDALSKSNDAWRVLGEPDAASAHATHLIVAQPQKITPPEDHLAILDLARGHRN